jgi:hypothetical protein
MRRVATRNLCVRAFCVALRHSVLSSMRAQRRVGGCVILCGSARVAGTHGRVRWLCPIRKPHNKRIKPTAFGSDPRVSPCQRAWCCGVRYLARGAAAYPRAVMRRVATQNLCVCAFCVALRHSVLSSMHARRRVGGCVILCGSARVAGTRGRVHWLCPIRKPHNKRIKPTAFGVGPRVQLCQRVWSCGVRYLARGGGGLYASRYAASMRIPSAGRWRCKMLGQVQCPNCGGYKTEVTDVDLLGILKECCPKNYHNRLDV